MKHDGDDVDLLCLLYRRRGNCAYTLLSRDSSGLVGGGGGQTLGARTKDAIRMQQITVGRLL